MDARRGKVLFYDIETAGVQGLCADRGFMVCFGYKWLGDSKARCITLTDFPGKHVHDDRELLKEALRIMEKADLLVAHYGDKFDRKFIEARLMGAKLPALPNTRQVDTCLLARSKLKLSSNRLGNLAEFLKVKTGKMNKRGGWPDWWMGALRGDKKAIADMAVYCAQDVQCLEECYLRIRHIIPNKYGLNQKLFAATQSCCSNCGGVRIQERGEYVSEGRLWKRLQCMNCTKWDKRPLTKAEKEALWS